MSSVLLARAVRRLVWQEDDCWVWSGGATRSGYAYILSSVHGGDYVHRLVYRGLVGSIPAGFQVDHLCRNRLCSNPLHLEAVTQAENIRRSSAPNAVAARTDTCLRGHSLTEHGHRRPNGRRLCRICAAARQRQAAKS